MQAVVEYASGSHASGGRVCKRWSCKRSSTVQAVVMRAVVEYASDRLAVHHSEDPCGKCHVINTIAD